MPPAVPEDLFWGLNTQGKYLVFLVLTVTGTSFIHQWTTKAETKESKQKYLTGSKSGTRTGNRLLFRGPDGFALTKSNKRDGRQLSSWHGRYFFSAAAWLKQCSESEHTHTYTHTSRSKLRLNPGGWWCYPSQLPWPNWSTRQTTLRSFASSWWTAASLSGDN